MEKLKRKRGDRRDGIWLRDLDALHTIMPYIYPNRADNEAFISERIDLEPINRYLEEKNRGNDGEPYKFFQLLIAALVKTITLRPKMNRFIQGYRIYQRNVLTMGFVVKRSLRTRLTRRWPSYPLNRIPPSRPYTIKYWRKYTAAAAMRRTTLRRVWRG